MAMDTRRKVLERFLNDLDPLAPTPAEPTEPTGTEPDCQ